MKVETTEVLRGPGTSRPSLAYLDREGERPESKEERIPLLSMEYLVLFSCSHFLKTLEVHDKSTPLNRVL